MTAPVEPWPRATAPASRPPVFSRASLLTLLAVWFPASPLVVAWFAARFAEAFLGSNLHVGTPTLGRGLFALTVTILGPFTALIEGRNRADCWRFAMDALPVCGGALLLGILVQVFWRPTDAWCRAIRLALLGAGLFVWIAGAIVTVLQNSG